MNKYFVKVIIIIFSLDLKTATVPKIVRQLVPALCCIKTKLNIISLYITFPYKRICCWILVVYKHNF